MIIIKVLIIVTIFKIIRTASIIIIIIIIITVIDRYSKLEVAIDIVFLIAHSLKKMLNSVFVRVDVVCHF